MTTRYKVIDPAITEEGLFVSLETVAPDPEPEPEPKPEPDGAPPRLAYQGSFVAAHTDTSGGHEKTDRYTWGGDAFSAWGQNVAMSTHTHRRFVGRMRIPETLVRIGRVAGIRDLPQAFPINNAIDIIGDLDDETRREQDAGGRMELTSLVWGPDGGYRFLFPNTYNVANVPFDSLGRIDFNLLGSERDGPFGLVYHGHPLPDQHFGQGMCRVSDAWSGVLGNYISLGGGRPGQGATGLGPVCYGFNWEPDENQDFAATRFLFYPDSHPLADWNFTCRPSACEWIGDYLAIIVLRGFGHTWYGLNPSPEGYMDPFASAKGFHAERYERGVFYYHGRDLARVARGELETWEAPHQYEVLPEQVILGRWMNGVRVSRDGDKFYILQQNRYREKDWYEALPVVHVYQIEGEPS